MTQFSNTTLVAGNLTGDMKIVTTSATLKDGSPFLIAEGTLAINGHGENAQPTFVLVQVVGYNAKRLIDAGKHLKGANFGVSGVLVNEKYTDQNGQTRSRVKVKGDDVMFGDKFFGNFNSVTLYGHAAADPVVGTKNDVTHARLTVGNNIYDRSKKEQVSSFFDVVAFGNRANFLGNYFHKGDAVMIQGRIHSSKYEKNQPDGSVVMQYRTDIVVGEIAFAQRKKSDVSTVEPTPSQDEPFYGNVYDGADYSEPSPVPNFAREEQVAPSPFANATTIDIIDEELPF